MTYPFIEISEVAKKESWRKEIYRPIYHLHKWWAQRLGSVFRANIIHAVGNCADDEWADFYKEHNYGKTILDPFMGSGTTLGEAIKLGCNAIGCDINPVSTFLVGQEFCNVPLIRLEVEYRKLEATVGETIRELHRTVREDGRTLDVLYYFWVMIVDTPNGDKIPLFKNYVISKNAYPSKKPEIQVLCPSCGNVFESVHSEHSAICPECGVTFDPWKGTVSGSKVNDAHGNTYRITDLLKPGKPPEEKLYALLAVDGAGRKYYLPANEYDQNLFLKAESLLAGRDLPSPMGEIQPGFNADQPRGYGFTKWSDLYNARELFCLGLLLDAIMNIEDEAVRGQFVCLFNGTAEFNNKFCSYKGEGTGAVRPIFSNHILKPERTPVENSVWGFDQSSGCFSTLYRSRLQKAKQYLDAPFEVKCGPGEAKPVCSKAIRPSLPNNYAEACASETPWALILNGDSSKLPLPDCCVDAVITDPPYFDFVNYSELSDFFHSWLKTAYPSSALFAENNSRRDGEVQRADYLEFSGFLANVFAECHRVMKDDAVLMFSFHHSRNEGWEAIQRAIKKSGFYVAEVYPVYAELAAATPKAAAKEPISIDMLIVCRKDSNNMVVPFGLTCDYCLEALKAAGFKLSEGDRFVLHSGFGLLN